MASRTNRQTDDLDLGGHHLIDWRYLGDIPRGGASVGQAMVWDGTSWNPGTVASGTGTSVTTWGDVQNKPTTFAPAAHTHLLADVTDYITPTAGSHINLTSNLTISTTGLLAGLTAGTNISTNGSTIAVIDAPTFAGTVTAEQAVVSSTNFASRVNLQSTLAVTATGLDSTVLQGVQSDITYESGGAGAFAVGTIKGITSNITVVNNSPSLSLEKAILFSGTLNASKMAMDSGALGSPVKFSVSNVSSTQAWSEGFLSVDMTGASGDCIATYTRARISSSANGIGYRGYSTGASGSTGTIIGVQGYVTDNRNTYTAAIGVDGLPFGGTGDKNLVMGMRCSRHLLVRSGSIFCGTAASDAPADLSPTFVQANTNKGEMYVEGNTEIAGQLCLATSFTPSTSGATGTLGQVAWDSSYVYVCIAANSWKRAAVAAW